MARRPIKFTGLMLAAFVLVGGLNIRYLSHYINKYKHSRLTSFDVIVVGADPEGISAAVSSARNGMSTLLVDGRGKLGGLWTLGGLNFIDMNCDAKGGLVTRGIFEEFYRAVNASFLGHTHYRAFNVLKAESVFMRMTDNESNLAVKLQTPVERVVMNGKTVVGIVVNEQGKQRIYYGKRIIDATQDANIAAQAGVPYYVGMEDFNMPDEWQPMTLIFEMNNVNWPALEQEIRKRGKSVAGVDPASAWGFLKIMRGYKHVHSNICVRGLNIGRLSGDHVLINAMQILGVNPLDGNAKRQAMRDAWSELGPLTQYICRHIPGFEHAHLVGAMPELYVRESRHICGQYTLSVNDIMDNRNFPDKIALGSYPLDIQRTSSRNHGYVLADPGVYSIPFRCLVPRCTNNLLVVGRSASFDSLAHGSARTVPVGMATGQAAGVACRYSIEDNVPFYRIPHSPEIHYIQNTLVQQGACLDSPSAFARRNPKPCTREDIRFLRSIGSLVGGYKNDYKLNAPVPSIRVINMTAKSEQRSFIRRSVIPIDFMQSKAISKQQAAKLLLLLAGKTYNVPNPIQKTVKLGMISPKTVAQISQTPKFNNSTWFRMLKDFIHYRKLTGTRVPFPKPHFYPYPAKASNSMKRTGSAFCLLNRWIGHDRSEQH